MLRGFLLMLSVRGLLGHQERRALKAGWMFCRCFQSLVILKRLAKWLPQRVNSSLMLILILKFFF